MKITAKKQSKLNMTMKFFGKRGFRSNYSKVKPRIRIVAKVEYKQLTEKVRFNSGSEFAWSDPRLNPRYAIRSAAQSMHKNQLQLAMGQASLGIANCLAGLAASGQGAASAASAQRQAIGAQQVIDEQRRQFELRQQQFGQFRG